MCNAFSCIVTKRKKAVWKFGTDSHDDLLKIAKIDDDTKDPKLIKFCRVEISPKNMDYINPDKWLFKVDMDFTPTWWTDDHEKAAWEAFQKWSKLLDAVLVRKPIVHPFKVTSPEVTKEHIDLLKQWPSAWSSAWDSEGYRVGDCVGVSVRDSVWDSVRVSVGDSVGYSVGYSAWSSAWYCVGVSVRDSVWAYCGSFFRLPRSDWGYTDNIATEGYPFQCLVTLWEMGLVPSYDGKVWRLHGGPDAKVLWEGEF